MPEDRPPVENGPDDSGPDDSGRQALVQALSRPSRGQAVVAVLLFVVGFAGAMQVREIDRDDDYAGLRQSDLIRIFEGLTGTSQRAEDEIDRLTEARDDLLDDTSQREAALEQARQEATTLGILAGTIPAVGPGIRVTITDENLEVSSDTVLDTIQELRSTGAEAIEFNDRVRVVAQTSIESTEAGLELDGQLVEPPYVIDVIGEPSALAGSLEFFEGPADQVRQDGGELTSEPLEEVLIESTVRSSRPGLATPGSGQ
jgi:uncharacterized protein YlxW (UPF0749 family)